MGVQTGREQATVQCVADTKQYKYTIQTHTHTDQTAMKQLQLSVSYHLIIKGQRHCARRPYKQKVESWKDLKSDIF